MCREHYMAGTPQSELQINTNICHGLRVENKIVCSAPCLLPAHYTLKSWLWHEAVGSGSLVKVYVF